MLRTELTLLLYLLDHIREFIFHNVQFDDLQMYVKTKCENKNQMIFTLSKCQKYNTTWWLFKKKTRLQSKSNCDVRDSGAVPFQGYRKFNHYITNKWVYV